MSEIKSQNPADLLGDPKTFHSFIYTPMSEALGELERRLKDPELKKKIEEYLAGKLPESYKSGSRATLFRQIATPNFETLRFLDLSHTFHLKPLIWEYTEDKFTSNNPYKHSLGQLGFYIKENKKGEALIDYLNIIDFNASNGKLLSEVCTKNGSSLQSFHHNLFRSEYRNIPDLFFEASEWFFAHGDSAEKYYKNFLTLFVTHGILFENFLLDDEERPFIENIILPAFTEVMNVFGLKPLIVPLEPLDLESDRFWFCYQKELQYEITSMMNQ